MRAVHSKYHGARAIPGTITRITPCDQRRRQPRAAPIAAANHHAPARGAVHGRDGLDHLAKFQRGRPSAIQRGRPEEAEDPRVDPGVDDRARELALTLSRIDMLSDQGQKVAHSSKCCVSHEDTSFVSGGFSCLGTVSRRSWRRTPQSAGSKWQAKRRRLRLRCNEGFGAISVCG